MKLSDLNLIIAEGEGLTVEFKEKYTSKIDRDIVALANSKGGHIIISLTDSGKIAGEKLTNQMKAEIMSLARNCDPHIMISNISQVDDLVVIEVPEGDEKPYSCSSGYFRRLDAVTQKMTQKEVALVFKQLYATSFEERVCRDTTWTDISPEKIKTFFKEARISADTINPRDILTSLNLATKDGIKNAGVLFFAHEPRRHILQCETILVSFKGTSRVDIIDRKDIQDDLWTQYQEAMIFLKRHLSVRTEIKGLDRKDSYEIPLEALREAVANAIIHRDYNVRGTSIMVEVHEDRVIIKNPGGFSEGMSADKLGAFSIRRNELIADIFARMHRMERMGSRFKRIREILETEKLPFPKISSDNFFFIKFERPVKIKKDIETNADDGLVERLGVKLGVKQATIVKLIAANKHITIIEIAKKLGISSTAVENNIAKLKVSGIIRREGADKTGHWVLLEPK
jgi:ATP-dependent DNA helicase RecG